LGNNFKGTNHMVKTSKILSGIAALAMLGFSGSAFAQAQGSDTFTTSATLYDALVVDCGAGSLNFGGISRPSNYVGAGTVTIDAENLALPETSSGLMLSGNGGSLTCTVTGLDDSGATVEVLTDLNAGSTNVPVTLTGETDTDQTLLAALNVVFDDGLAGEGTVYIGGVLTLKDAGVDTGDASAQVYTSEAVTLLVTD